MDVCAEMLAFQDFEGLTEVFAPRRPPGYPRGCPLEIWPQNYSLGYFLVLELVSDFGCPSNITAEKGSNISCKYCSL